MWNQNQQSNANAYAAQQQYAAQYAHAQQQQQRQLYSNGQQYAQNGNSAYYAQQQLRQQQALQQQQLIAAQQQAGAAASNGHPQAAQQQQAQPTQQYNVTTNHYSQLVQHPNYTNNRSPFFQVEKRCCVMPVFSQKRIQFRINLQEEDVARIQDKKGEEPLKKRLHLRLFNFTTSEHQQWSTSQCDVSINNRKLGIDKRNTQSGVKKKGYHIVSPLDITKEAATTMDFEITSNGPFGGVAVIEIARMFSVEAIAKRVIARCTPIDPRKDKKCAICGKTQDLLRCSRCKCVWYCGTGHQAKDWPFHQTICSPTENKGKLQPIAFKQQSDDDDVVCGETKVSLRCPLSICRMQNPVRGTECTHPQCVDLQTFLAYSHRTGTWQCPVCLKPLKFDQIVIDNEMRNILQQTDDDIDLVRLYPNGSFKAITLQEQRDEELRIHEGKRKKRKRRNGEQENGNPVPPNLRGKSASNSVDASDALNSDPADDNGQNVINPIVLD